MTARVRISRVRFKAGGELHLLRPAVQEGRARVERQVRTLLDAMDDDGDVAGFAVVVWDKDGASACSHWHGPDSCVPVPLIPEFVRNRLLLGIGVGWTIDDVNEQWGHPPSAGA